MTRRRRVGLGGLRSIVQHTIALAIIIPIAAFAWVVGRDDPVPDWITDVLVPGLGWVGLILIVILIVDWVRQRRARG
jgi:hypothetical protein